MLIHQFTTELDKGSLEVLMAEATIPVIVKDGTIWTAEKGFAYVSCTLTLNRVSYDHAERRYNKHFPAIRRLLH